MLFCSGVPTFTVAHVRTHSPNLEVTVSLLKYANEFDKFDESAADTQTEDWRRHGGSYKYAIRLESIDRHLKVSK
jgi:hypothetical protein